MTQEMLKIKRLYEDFNNPLSPYANDNSNNEQEQNLKISKKAMSFHSNDGGTKENQLVEEMSIHLTALKM